MTGSPTDLLRMLGLASRPVSGAPAKASGPTTDIAGADFQALLQKAQEGSISSGREISIASDAGVKLDEGQLARLSVAADRAEAAGAKAAVVLIDGMAVKLDVMSRTVTGASDAAGASVWTGIDTVLSAPGGKAAGEAVPAPLPYQGGGFNPSLLKLLAKSSGGA